ncbi:hypothetical protein Tco_1201841 [Tanacetum coccineum]
MNDYSRKSDILFIEELLNNGSLSLPKNELFHPSSPRPPAKPPVDDGIHFDIEPDTGILTAKVVDDISEHYVLMPSILPTRCPLIDTFLPFSSENENKVFNYGILASNEEKSPHLLSHQGFKAFQIISDFSESPMMIYGGDQLNPKFSDVVIESFSPSPIPVEDNDFLMKEIDLFLTPDDSMPPGIENDDYESEGDILFLEELLSNDSPSLPKNESFHFDVPSSPRPPAKPSDDGIYFEPDTGLLTTKVVGDISKHYVLMPRLLPTQPTLCPVIVTLLPFSFKNEDKVHLLSHRGFNAFQFFSKNPMMIYGGNIPTLDVLIAPDYEASCARGFVLCSLELQSLA